MGPRPRRRTAPDGEGAPAGLDFSSRAVRARRGAREPVDPFEPLGVEVERERTPEGDVAPAVTVFLAGAECPFACVFCDLWRYTLEGPTPEGALPRQLERALAQADVAEADATVKLYNASNFFEPRAVPSTDLPALAERVAGFRRVVVECHPRLVGDACFAFAERLDGRLEVAMGLETVHPGALSRLNKGVGPGDFGRAAARLRGGGVDVRAFVLVGAPFVPAGEAVEWAVRAAAHALDAGAVHVSLIPVRGGNGTLELLAHHGDWTPPTLADLEAAMEGAMNAAAARDEHGGGGGPSGGAPSRGGRPVVTADLWDAGRLGGASDPCVCRDRRLERLARTNLSGVSEPRVRCEVCGSPGAPPGGASRIHAPTRGQGETP